MAKADYAVKVFIVTMPYLNRIVRRKVCKAYAPRLTILGIGKGTEVVIHSSFLVILNEVLYGVCTIIVVPKMCETFYTIANQVVLKRGSTYTEISFTITEGNGQVVALGQPRSERKKIYYFTKEANSCMYAEKRK